MERKLYDAASKGDVTTLGMLLKEDPYLVHGVSFPCSRNLLHIASMHGQAAIVEQVLNLNPRLAWILDSQKLSPLHIAAAEGHVEICQKLSSVAPEACWWRDCHGMSPVHIAAMKGHVETVERLIQVSHLPAMERVHRRETVLHLCVKHGQVKVLKVLVEKLGDLVDAIDEDGETIMHMAVRCNQLETIKYLVESNKIKRLTRNSMGKTELQILAESPGDTCSTYSEMRRMLLRLLPPSIHDILPKMSDVAMVVVVLIATMAYQNAVNPPGGVWQGDTSSHRPGDAVIAYTHPHVYKYLVCANTVAFGSSLLAIILIATGEPSRNIWLFRISVTAMCVSVAAIAVSYGVSTVVIAPDTKEKSVRRILFIVLYVCVIMYLIILFSFLLRKFYFNRNRKTRRQQPLRTNHQPKRTLNRIFQQLDTFGDHF